MLALGQDGDLERGQRAVVAAPDAPLGGRADGPRRVLVGVEAGDEDVGEEEQALAAVVVLAEAAEDARGNDFAERGARPVDVLAVARVGLFVEELGAVDEQAVYCVGQARTG